MMNFFKLEVMDQDSIDDDVLPVITIKQAESLEDLLTEEVKKYFDDDRLIPCPGTTITQALSADDDSIQFEPGDGEAFTIALYFPDTIEGAKALVKELFDRAP